ncbi:MAG: hypothetical protein ACR2RB_10890 [Gammaproteobacteria bacterium]
MADSKTEETVVEATPHCLHVVGIGRTGAGYVDGLLRTGEVEDLLMDKRARVAALVIDVGDHDLKRAEGYADALGERLLERGIPREHFHFQSVSLDVPQRDDLLASLGRVPDKAWLAEDVELPATGSHLTRAVAKAIYAKAYYDDPRPLDGALTAFAEHAEQSELPSRVMICFNLAGGTGSGMAVDLARHLANDKLGGRLPVIGVGQLPHSGDGDTPASLFASLNEFECMFDDSKNTGVTKGHGDSYGNPFSGGFFVVNTEHTWQRLTSYTDTGETGIRNRIRQEVTNKFAQDSFMRFAMRDEDSALSQVLAANGNGNWMFYNLAKFTHPGVQVLPGEPLSKWRTVIDQWIGHLDDFSGLKKEFRSSRADIHVHAPREIGFEYIDAKLKAKMEESFLSSNDAEVHIANHEFFDHLTSYADIVLPGLSPTHLERYWQARDAYEALGEKEQKMCHSWLLEKDVVVSNTEQAAS